jgi:hypothetical protein
MKNETLKDKLMEIKLKGSIETITGPLIHTQEFHPYDYKNISGNLFVELKCRNCLKNTYPTTMISMYKINKMKPENEYYFFFNFHDGLYYWKYTINTFDIKTGGRYDRGNPELNKYLFIPVNKLTSVD